MRVIHLCFQLHEPFAVRKFEGELPYFESKSAFEQANKEIYQPFFALLERNTQKNKGFRVSLVVSGLWIELAEHYDSELLRRLKKLVNLGQVELIAEPYYHSLAFFYDKDELASEVKQYQTKVQLLFGAKTQVFCLPEFLYNDAIGKWAEEAGFAGMLAGSSERALGWHTANRVYEAADCEYLRVLFRNASLSDALMYSEPKVMAEQVVDKEKQLKKMMLSVVKFQKLLDLEFLRGGLVNLYLDADCMGRLRDVGVIAFFDGLFESWLDQAKNKFATASMACVVEAPSAEVTVPEAVSWYRENEVNNERLENSKELVAGLSLKLPEGLNGDEQLNFARELYGLRREILATEDEKLIDDYRHLLAIDYQLRLDDESLENYRKIMRDMKSRAETIKKQQAVEISRTFTKRHDRGEAEQPKAVFDDVEVEIKMSAPKPVVTDVDDGIVAVHFGGTRKAGPSSSEVHVRVDTPVDTAPAQAVARPTRLIEVTDANDDAEVSFDDSTDDVDEMMEWAGAKEGQTVNEEKKGLKHSIRRVIKKLVIE